MDNEPEVIRRQMEDTRTALSEKLETLEQQVVGTVQGATAAVNETVESVKEVVQDTVCTVKDVVQDTVDTVKGSVEETVETVKETFDLRHQVDQHPWAMVGGSVALGYLGGFLFAKSETCPAKTGRRYDSSLETSRVSIEQNGLRSFRPLDETAERKVAPESASSTGKAGWMDELSNLFGPEIDKLKGLAIGAMMGTIRDLINQSVPREVQPRIKEVMDDITTKLGGETLRGPLLETSAQPKSPMTGFRRM